MAHWVHGRSRTLCRGHVRAHVGGCREQRSPLCRTPHHPLVQLARAAIDAYVCEGHILSPEEAPAPIEGQPAGVFVTLHTAQYRRTAGLHRHHSAHRADTGRRNDPATPLPRPSPTGASRRSARTNWTIWRSTSASCNRPSTSARRIELDPQPLWRDCPARQAPGTVAAGHTGHRRRRDAG